MRNHEFFQNSYNNFNTIRDSLQEKSGASTKNIDFIEIYECVEI
jgi:hypothetical protein